MGSTIKTRLWRFNGTDYDTVHLETDGSVVKVPTYVSILNTDSPILGDKTVYFTAYPDIKWQVQHIDGDYVYLALTGNVETTVFGSNSTYAGSTIASKCTTFLNNTIPNVANYLEEVTVNGVTAKVFIPSYDQLNSEWDYPKQGASQRATAIDNWSSVNYEIWTSTATDSSNVWVTRDVGEFSGDRLPSYTYGFRPAVKVNYKQTIPSGITTRDLNTALSNINYSLQNIDGANVTVTVEEEFTNPLNTDQLTLGQHDVCFKAYPDITWQVQHLDGDYAYLSLYPMTEKTSFGSDTTYSGSTIASKCTTFLNSTIPNVANYLEDVTMEGVTSKVFIPSYDQFNSEWDWPKAGASNRICQLNGSSYRYWLSTGYISVYVWSVYESGDFARNAPSTMYGFRPAVKVRYKATPVIKNLNTAISDLSYNIINGGTTPPTSKQPVNGLWFEDVI